MHLNEGIKFLNFPKVTSTVKMDQLNVSAFSPKYWFGSNNMTQTQKLLRKPTENNISPISIKESKESEN